MPDDAIGVEVGEKMGHEQKKIIRYFNSNLPKTSSTETKKSSHVFDSNVVTKSSMGASPHFFFCLF